MKFRKGFTKTVSGYFEIEAKDEEEAQEKLDCGEGDEFDNKSDYITDEDWEKI